VPVDEPDVLVVPMIAYDLALSLRWFQSRNPEIDWSNGQLLGLWTPVRNPGNEQTITSLPQGDGGAEDGACEPPQAVYIQFLGATTFNVLVMRLSQPLARHIDEGTGILGASTMSEGVTLENWWDEPQSMLNRRAGSTGSSCG